MVLTVQTTSVGETTTAEKTIAVTAQGSAYAVIYTVPSGRKFKGNLWTNQPTYFGVINSQDMRTPHRSSYYAQVPLPIELRSGDIVKASPTASDYTMIQGIESDA